MCIDPPLQANACTPDAWFTVPPIRLARQPGKSGNASFALPPPVPVPATLPAVVPATTAGGAPAAAAGYPERPIRLIMGFPPGSTVDILARPVAQRLSDAFGQPVIVDNRSGATGIIANELVARAQPDGHTLLAAPSSSLTSTPHLATRLPYDALRDFVAVDAGIKGDGS